MRPSAPSTPPVHDWLGTLSDRTRTRLLRLTSRAELSVGELCRILELPQSTASRHLKTLVDDGWLEARRDGTSRFYRLAFADRSGPREALWRWVTESLAREPQSAVDDERLDRVLTERQHQSQAFFAGAATQWQDVRAQLFGDYFQQQLLPALLNPEEVVADLGCGAGTLSALIAPHVARIDALDCSPAMVDAAHARLEGFGNVTVHLGDVAQIPLPNEGVTLALLVLVLHTLKQPDHALSEVARVLAPGGRVVVMDMLPHEHTRFKTELGHQWLGFPKAAIERSLAAAGLAITHFSLVATEGRSPRPALFLAVGSKPLSAAHQMT